jgi:MtN3 and saliva related transmembrane protein
LNSAVIIGGVAAVASTSSFVPQACQIIRTRDTSAISSGMYVVTVAAFALWTAYGALLSEWPLIASNGISLILSAFILTMKLLPHRAKERIAHAIDPASNA